jgi:hypothetical protein
MAYKIALIAIRSGPGAASSAFEAVVLGTVGEGNSEVWRYACFPLDQLKRLFQNQANPLDDPANLTDYQVQTYDDQAGSEPRNLLWPDEIDTLVQDDLAEAGSEGLLRFLTSKDNAGDPGLRIDYALPLRDVVQVVFFASENNQPGSGGGPLALFDTCRNVFANGADQPEPPFPKPQSRPLGSRIILFRDRIANKKGALAAFAVFGQIRLVLDGHDRPSGNDAEDRAVRAFLRLTAFRPKNGDTANPRSLWTSDPKKGSVFDTLRIGTSNGAGADLARASTASYSPLMRGSDLVGWVVQAEQNNGYLASDSVFVRGGPVFERLGLKNGYELKREIGLRTFTDPPNNPGQEWRVGLRFEGQVSADADKVFNWINPLLPFPFKLDFNLVPFPDVTAVRFAQEQPLDAINWDLTPAKVTRWVFTARIVGTDLGGNIVAQPAITKPLLDAYSDVVSDLHKSLRRAHAAKPLSFLPKLSLLANPAELVWHAAGAIEDSEPWNRTIAPPPGGPGKRDRLQLSFFRFEPRFIGNMWFGRVPKASAPQSAAVQAVLDCAVLTDSSLPTYAAQLVSPQIAHTADASSEACTEAPCYQPATSPLAIGDAPIGTAFALRMGDPGSPSPRMKGKRIRIGALQFTMAVAFDKSVEFPFDYTSVIRLLSGPNATSPADVSVEASVKLPAISARPAAQDSTLQDDLVSQSAGDALLPRSPNENAPLVIVVDPETDGSVFKLTADEAVTLDQDYTIGLRLQAFASDAQVAQLRVMVIDPAPFRVALVQVPPMGARVGDSTNEVAVWNADTEAGPSWRLIGESQGVHFLLPPQTVGEAMEKNASSIGGEPPDVQEKQAVPARFASPTHLVASPSPLDQNYQQPGWNLRIVLGTPGDRNPGMALKDIRLELMYGMIARLAPSDVQIAEIQATIGAPPAPLPADNAELSAYLQLSAAVLDREGQRIAVDKLWRTDLGADLKIEDGVQFRLRTKGLYTALRWPIAGGVPADLDQNLKPAFSDAVKDSVDDNTKIKEVAFAGGVSWAFESQNILRSVYSVPDSTGGQASGIHLSALGGYGHQRALFDRNKTIIETDTSQGRVHRYALERVGRIGALWNRAKHVIVYERSVVPSNQFYNNQEKEQDELAGRPVLRKVEEYVQLIQPLRRYPESSAGTVSAAGCLVGTDFKSERIRVDSSWGGDVGHQGWQVPLWNRAFAHDPANADDPDDAAFVYPKPHIRVLMATATGGEIAVEIAEPEKLVFYTSVLPQDTGDNVDSWSPVQGVDFIDAPIPAVGAFPADPDSNHLTDAPLPPEPAHIPGHERLTLALVLSKDAAALTNGRQSSGPSAVLKNVTIGRSAKNPAITRNDQVVPSGRPQDLYNAINKLTANATDVRRLVEQTTQAFSREARIVEGQNDVATAVQDVRNRIAAATQGLDVAGTVSGAVQDATAGLGLKFADQQSARFSTLCDAEIAKAKSWRDQTIADATDGFNDQRLLILARAQQLDTDLATAKAQAQSLLDGLSANLNDIVAQAEVGFGRAGANVQALASEVGGRVDGVRQALDAPITDVMTNITTTLTKMDQALLDLSHLTQPILDGILLALDYLNGSLLSGLRAVGGLADQAASQALDDAVRRIVLVANKYVADAESIIVALKGQISTISDAKANLKTVRGEIDQAGQVLKNFTQALDDRNQLAPGAAGGAPTLIDKLQDSINRIIVNPAYQPSGGEIPGAADCLSAEAADAQNLLKAQHDGIPTCTTVAAVQSVLNACAQIVGDISANVANGIAAGSEALDKAIADARSNVVNALSVVSGQIDQALDKAVFQTTNGAATWINGALAGAERQLNAAVDSALGPAINTMADLNQALGDLQGDISDITSEADGRARELLGAMQKTATDALGADPMVVAQQAAGVFQQGNDTLRLLRALGDPPQTDRLGLNRPEVAYVFDEINSVVDMTPAIALVNRVADSYAAAEAAGTAVSELLTSFGIRLPTSGIADQILPDELKGLSIAKLFPDMSGLKLDGLLERVGFPDLNNESNAMQVRQGFDQNTLTAWLEADIDVPFGDDSTPMFDFGPVSVVVDDAQFASTASFSAGPNGVEKAMHGSISGDWRVVAAGQTVVTFVQTELSFDQTGKIDFQIQPDRVELAEVLQFLTTLVQASGQTGELQVVPYMAGSIPAGVAVSLDLDLPDIQSGVFGISNLSLHLLFGVLAVPTFQLKAELFVATKISPFTLNVWLLNGGGFFTSSLSYLPTAKPQPYLVFSLEAGIVAGVGIGFSFGVISGGVWLQVGCSISVMWTTQGGGSATAIHVFILVRGNVDVAGLITASIALLMDVSYDGSEMVGTGSLDFSIKLSVFYTFQVSQHVEYRFAGGNKKQVSNYGNSYE